MEKGGVAVVMDDGYRADGSAGGGSRPRVVVILGPTGAGKSRLAIDLSQHYPIEIINADSMQVYQGLDVLTNKVPVHQRNGVPHHLLGTVSPSTEFTSKKFRDSAFLLIGEIISRKRLPVIVGGTNYYVQALACPFLADDMIEGVSVGGEDDRVVIMEDDSKGPYERLAAIDPVAANRIHPNDERKINQYIGLHERFGVIPSEVFRSGAAEKWGGDGFRVDAMVESGLLEEVMDVFSPDSDYTHGLRQAIGVREFHRFFTALLERAGGETTGYHHLVQRLTPPSPQEEEKDDDALLYQLLKEGIGELKGNTRKLVRRQKRRLRRLRTEFGWDIHYLDSSAFLQSRSMECWGEVVRCAVALVGSFVAGEMTPTRGEVAGDASVKRRGDLWSRHTCEACGNKVLRGAREWEQHRAGRSHRKRMSSIRRNQLLPLFSAATSFS